MYHLQNNHPFNVFFKHHTSGVMSAKIELLFTFQQKLQDFLGKW